MMSRYLAVLSHISRLSGKAEHSPVNGISLQEVLRWNTNRIMPRLGWPGVLAIVLLVVSISLYFSTISPMQDELEALKQSMDALRNPSSRQAKIDLSGSQTEQLAEFYRFFPPEKDSPKWLGMMMEIAVRNGITLNHGDYAVVRDAAGQLRRFRITLPVQGTYPQIRKYLATLIADIPSMSLENVQFERKGIEDTDLKANIKLVLYLRQGS
jgi:Tfp pilus assembly protein PilO